MLAALDKLGKAHLFLCGKKRIRAALAEIETDRITDTAGRCVISFVGIIRFPLFFFQPILVIQKDIVGQVIVSGISVKIGVGRAFFCIILYVIIIDKLDVMLMKKCKNAVELFLCQVLLLLKAHDLRIGKIAVSIHSILQFF